MTARSRAGSRRARRTSGSRRTLAARARRAAAGCPPARPRAAAASAAAGRAADRLSRYCVAVAIEPEHAGQRLEHLRRRVAVAALLEPQVVVGADAGEGRDLLAAQARRPPDAHDAQPRVGGVHQLAPRTQVLAERVRPGHMLIVRGCAAAHPGPAAPRMTGVLAARPARRGIVDTGAAPAANRKETMTSHQPPRRHLPGRRSRLTRVGYGAMQLAGPGVFGPPKDRDAAIAVLRTAVDLGINHIDTADFYGPYVTNEIIREALAPYPDDLHIVTKVGAPPRRARRLAARPHARGAAPAGARQPAAPRARRARRGEPARRRRSTAIRSRARSPSSSRRWPSCSSRG